MQLQSQFLWPFSTVKGSRISTEEQSALKVLRTINYKLKVPFASV